VKLRSKKISLPVNFTSGKYAFIVGKKKIFKSTGKFAGFFLKGN
jgi:hypothetical protein